MVVSANLEAQASAAGCCAPSASLAGEKHGVALSGDALPHGLDQGQRETPAVGQPAEQHVQDAQDLRKVGLVRHLFIRQEEAA